MLSHIENLIKKDRSDLVLTTYLATLQGQKVKRISIQNYVVRPETESTRRRRHSAFYVGQHLYHWLKKL